MSNGNSAARICHNLARLVRRNAVNSLLVAVLASAARMEIAAANPAETAAIVLALTVIGMPALYCASRIRDRSSLLAVPAVIGFGCGVGRALLPAPILAAIPDDMALATLWRATTLAALTTACLVFIALFRRHSGSVEDRIARALGTALPIPPEFAPAVGKELSLFYYALFAWQSAPEIPPGGAAFSVDRRSTDPPVLWVVLGLSVVETSVIHVFVRHWSRELAWVLTDLGLLGMVLLLGTSGSHFEKSASRVTRIMSHSWGGAA
jgi:hypothetical protein